MISVRGDAVVIEYDKPTMEAALANDPRKSQVRPNDSSVSVRRCFQLNSFIL